MLWLWILLAIGVLIVLLCRIRVGVWAAFGGEELRLDVKLGLVRVHILPAGHKKPKKPEKPRKERPKKEKPQKKGEKGGGKPSFAPEDIKDALRTLLPALKRTLRRTRRGIRIKPLRLSMTLGGQEDPAAAAQLYGELQAAVWAGMPVLERLVDVRDPHIHVGVDFNTPDTAVEGEAGAGFRVGTLIAMGFGLAFPALGWFLRWRKRCKNRPPKPEEKARDVPAEGGAA